MTDRCWRIAADTGGTFTDCVAVDPSGRTRVLKVLSSARVPLAVVRWIDPCRAQVNHASIGGSEVLRGLVGLEVLGDLPRAVVSVEDDVLHLDGPVQTESQVLTLASSEPAPVLAARLITGTASHAALPPLTLRLATTRATNALLERRGARSGLLVTRGFGDLPVIGDQRRPHLFRLFWPARAPLACRVLEIDERSASDGSVVRPLDEEMVTAAARTLRDEGTTSASIAFLHAWANPAHERRAAEILAQEGFDEIACSSECGDAPGFLPRMESAQAEAYLGPVMRRFLSAVSRALPGSALDVMTSDGALRGADVYRATDGLLSGPAAGALGAAEAGRRNGASCLIGFDMGGTSTDVCRLQNGPLRVVAHEVGGIRIAAPATSIETVAAGGGSICSWRHGVMCVGPESAGADPGPACYGAGGPLTLTDVDLLLGRLQPEGFSIPLDRSAAHAALEAFRNEGGRAAADASDEALLEGLVAIADERMAAAIERISLSRGIDPAESVLCAFGGAGGQHACAVAERLRMRSVLLPARASVLSAEGLHAARHARTLRRSVLQPLADVQRELPSYVARTRDDAIAALAEDGVPSDAAEVAEITLLMRRRGQEERLEIPWEDGAEVGLRFEEAHQKAYAVACSAARAEVESVRVIVRRRDEIPESRATHDEAPADDRVHAAPAASPRRRVVYRGAQHDVPEIAADQLRGDSWMEGPALIAGERTTLLVPADWRVRRTVSGDVLATRPEASDTEKAFAGAGDTSPAVVRRALFSGRAEAIAADMGTALARSAVSVNIRERLDFSCAVLDAQGMLLVSAPHVPVHLGALGLCVRSVYGERSPRRDEVVVVNHPAFGGSHLPDVTLVHPVFAPGGSLIGFVAVRAHHAEIGGTRPGSMPPDAKVLEAEGVVIPPTFLRVSATGIDWAPIDRLLRTARLPSRSPDENVADLAAQYAAARQGASELTNVAAEMGTEHFLAACEDLQEQADEALRGALAAKGSVRGSAQTKLDDGSIIRVRLHMEDERLVIDFAGSSPPHAGNLNAPPAVVRAAVLYVLRLLTDEHLPLAEGLMRSIDLRVPRSLLNPPLEVDPARCPAVVGGNVETSQRVVGVLLAALGLSAESQGTMNNVLFGDTSFGHYETIGGGAGAGPDSDGPSGTHVHMTNTRITDPEILELRYPIRLEQFALRGQSGGAGRRPGGHGLIRSYRFLKPLSVSLLALHRSHGPAGAEGGEAGAPGDHELLCEGGERRQLPGCVSFEASVGDLLIVRTPGGGGWGRAGTV